MYRTINPGYLTRLMQYDFGGTTEKLSTLGKRGKNGKCFDMLFFSLLMCQIAFVCITPDPLAGKGAAGRKERGTPCLGS